MDKIALEKIKIGERFRKEFGDLGPLKQSIKLRGLLQPIVISRDFLLIAGERRLRAHAELGMQEIGYIFRDQVDDVTAKELELEENICRKDFSPEEEVNAILEIHRLKESKYGVSHHRKDGSGGWTLEDTAGALGISKATVVNYITVARHLEDMPEVKETLKRQGVTAAYKLVRYLQEQAATTAMSELIDQELEDAVDETDESTNIIAARLVDSFLFHADCTEGIKSIPSGTVNLVFTDPPYAIFIDEVKRSDEFAGDIYSDDSPEAWKSVWEKLAPELYRVASPNSHAFVWISWDMIDTLMGLMEKAGWKTMQLPYVWVRQGTGYQNRNPAVNLSSACDFAIVFTKGSPLLAKPGTSNGSIERVLPDILKTHPLERPAILCMDIITTFVTAGSVVLDCFGGGMSTAKACVPLGIRPIIFEKDREYYERGRIELIKMLTGKLSEPAPEVFTE